MARREYEIIQGGGGLPDPETDPDCIFYAPLTEGDLTDHKSGESFVMFTSGTNSIDWDNVVEAYHFIHSNSRGQSGSWKNLNLGLDWSNYGFTLTWKARLNYSGTDNSYKRSVQVGGYLTISQNNKVVPPDDMTYSSMGKDIWYTLCITYKPTGYGDTYIDASIVQQDLTITKSSNYGTFDVSYLNSMISIGKKDGSYGTAQKTDCWCKDIRIYNRVLTLDEISSL